MSPNHKRDDFLTDSGLMLSGFFLEKQDFQGRIIHQFDLREIPEIIIGKQRVYGCIILTIVAIYLGIICSWVFLGDQELGLSIAIFIGGCGMFGLFFLENTHHYYITFYYRNRSILYQLEDSEEKIKRFIEKLQDNIHQANPKLILRNLLTEDDEEDDNDDEE